MYDSPHPYMSMIMDAMRMNHGYAYECWIIDEAPNADTTRFFLSFERLQWIIMGWVHKS